MTVEEQLQIIRRGVDQVVPEQELVEKLRRSVQTGEPLRVKYGIDPTGIDVHLGHTVPLRKLKQFQDLGHTAVIIIGNYTALVGDPSGRDQTRTRLTQEIVEQNAEDYLRQIERVIDLGSAEVHRNGDWFGAMDFRSIIELCSQMTVARLLERDDFSKRIKAESPIYLHECLYPLMQGWDSVEIRADIELGGSEQLFSLMVARDLQRSRGQEPQVAVTLPILVGLDGSRRMGKSLQNYVGVAEQANEMFGKLMSLPDACMRSYFELLTDRPLQEIDRLLDAKAHPRDAKVALAREIVTQYHDRAAADSAAREFDRRFREGQDPAQVPEVEVSSRELENGCIWLPKLMVLCGIAKSNGEARRLIQQGGVTLGPERQRISDEKAEIEIEDGMVLRAGKRRVVRIRLK